MSIVKLTVTRETISVIAGQTAAVEASCLENRTE